MARKIINFGAAANDGTGDTLRNGAQKINDNFNEIYTALGGSIDEQLSFVSSIVAGDGIVAGTSAGQVLVSSKVATALQLGGIKIGSGLTIDGQGVVSSQVYNLPKASTNLLGGIKVGDGLEVDINGVLSALPGSYTLPTATSEVLGGIKVGAGLSMSTSGTPGVLSLDLPKASFSTVGGVRVGSGLDIDTETGILTLSLFEATKTTIGGIQGLVEDEIALGSFAGETLQGVNALAIGAMAGRSNQGQGSVAIGFMTGRISQGNRGVAIGDQAAYSGQGDNAIAIGYLAGYEDQSPNSIVINASGTALSGNSQTGFYVSPIRPAVPTVSVVYYNSVTKEITYGPVPDSVLELDSLTNDEFSVVLGDNGVLEIPNNIFSSSSIEISSSDDISVVAANEHRLYANGLFSLRNYSGTDSVSVVTAYNTVSEKSWLFDVYGRTILPSSTPPVSSRGTEGDVVGSLIIDAEYIYYCTASYTDGLADIWRRTPHATQSW
jgi:hypothetical protein